MRSFYHVTKLAQSAPMFAAGHRKQRLDATLTCARDVSWSAVSRISQKCSRAAACAGLSHPKWRESRRVRSMQVGNREHWLGPLEQPTEYRGLRSRHGACSRFSLSPSGSGLCGPPKTARTDWLSMTANERSSWPTLWSAFQQAIVNMGPYAHSSPISQSSPATAAAVTTQFFGQHAPGGTRANDEDDTQQRRPIGNRRPPAFGFGLQLWQKRRNFHPQFFRQKFECHAISPSKDFSWYLSTPFAFNYRV